MTVNVDRKLNREGVGGYREFYDWEKLGEL